MIQHQSTGKQDTLRNCERFVHETQRDEQTICAVPIRLRSNDTENLREEAVQLEKKSDTCRRLDCRNNHENTSCAGAQHKAPGTTPTALLTAI